MKRVSPTRHSILTAEEKVSPDYTNIPRPGNIAPRPEGGHKIICEVCQTVCRTKPDDAKSFCEYVARANGWRARNKNWCCPEHLKTVLPVAAVITGQPSHRKPVGGIVRLRTRYPEGLKR